MAIVTFILGNSGEGKSFSLKHIDPKLCGIINISKKPLPFKDGHLFAKRMINSDNAEFIKEKLVQSQSPIIIIDDFQYLMAYEFLRGTNQQYKGDAVFQRYNELAYKFWSVIDTAINLDYEKRVYILAHTQENNGRTSIKTIGKMIDEKIVPEGMVTTVLYTRKNDDCYFFSTQNNGFNTAKSPEGMFDSELIPNDLNFVDDCMCSYYNISKNPNQPQTA